MVAALIAGFQQHESGMIHHKAIWFFMPVSALALTVSESVHKDCCRPEAAVRLPFIECLLIDIGTQWEACVRLRPDAGALGHPPSNQACRKRRDGI